MAYRNYCWVLNIKLWLIRLHNSSSFNIINDKISTIWSDCIPLRIKFILRTQKFMNFEFIYWIRCFLMQKHVLLTNINIYNIFLFEFNCIFNYLFYVEGIYFYLFFYTFWQILKTKRNFVFHSRYHNNIKFCI